MTQIALILAEKAGQIQKTVGDFNCTLDGIAISSNNMAKVSVSGEDSDVQALFESIGETLNDETHE